MTTNNEILLVLKKQMIEDLKSKFVEINLMPQFDTTMAEMFDIYAKNYATMNYEGRTECQK